ncbi:hypothetical protein [Xenorhabdus santafensis]|uniref:hypothetical protein n=1 Tax=Xenorhabdus santafensis TaxID=2582833 RepID=UPI0029E7FE92|nr:hypothetical protein [Xenorhabdus sp. 12]
MYAAKGKKGGLQILPFSQISAKEEFSNVKEEARDDLLAIHRVPPQLMSELPSDNGNYGDVEKAAKVFSINELKKGGVFVQLCRGGETLSVLGFRGIGMSRKTVQTCEELRCHFSY